MRLGEQRQSKLDCASRLEALGPATAPPALALCDLLDAARRRPPAELAKVLRVASRCCGASSSAARALGRARGDFLVAFLLERLREAPGGYVAGVCLAALGALARADALDDARTLEAVEAARVALHWPPLS